MDFKLGICEPVTNDFIFRQYHQSFTAMIKPAEFHYSFPQFPASLTSDIAVVRNNLVREALEANCTHIFTLDTDQDYPQDTLVKLMEHIQDGKQIVSAKVHRRYPPFDPILLRGLKPGDYKLVPADEWRERGAIQVDATGAACMLIDTNVFLDVPFPWYERGETPDGRPVGEDINFCYKARAAGYEIWVDTSIEVQHMAIVGVNRGFFEITQLIDRARSRSKTEAKEGDGIQDRPLV